MKRVYSIDFQLNKVTGVEKVMLDVHHAVNYEYNAKIVGNIPYGKVHKAHNIKPEEYVRFKNPFIFYKSIVIVHERKLLLLMWLLNHLLFQRIKIVYVHHSIFYNHKRTTMLPKTIVAISDRGIENLLQYFGVPRHNIFKIHNCVVDQYKGFHRTKNNDKTTLILPGRINSYKQQFEIVNHLRGKLDKRILIRFAGDGERLDELRTLCEGDANFEVLGYRDDVINLLEETDYILLYSTQEGLSITLIEATMVGMPIVCNDVGGNNEICFNNKNGWLVGDWDDLINTINKLPNIPEEQYLSMCRRSRRIYDENFTYDLFKKKYLNLLENL